MTGVHELKTTADLIKASILEGLENSIKSGELPAIVTNDASVERPRIQDMEILQVAYQ